MEILKIFVPGMIWPGSAQDTYPTHASIFGLGGHKEVATIADRDAIPASRLTIGSEVFVEATGITYVLMSMNPNVWEDRNQVIYSYVQQNIATVNATIATLPTMSLFNDVVTSIQEVEDRAVANTLAIEALSSRVDNITSSESFTDILNRIAVLESAVSALESTQEAQGALMATITGQYDTLNTTVTSLSNTSSNHETRITNLEQSLAEVIADVADYHAEVSSISQTVISVQNSLAGIQSSLNTHTSQISALNTQLTTVATSISTINSRLTVITNSINTINSEIQAIKEDIYPLDITLTADNTIVPNGRTRNVVLNWSIKRDKVEITPDALYLRKTTGSTTTTSTLAASLKTLTVSLSANTTLTLVAVYDGIQYTKAISIQFFNPCYYGSVSATPSSSTIVSLTSVLLGELGFEWRQASTNTKFCFAVPNSLGMLSGIFQNGIDVIASFTRTALTINGEVYNVYTLTDPVVVTKVNLIFK